ncbi:MAG TPA: hypothetical protein DEF79_13185 [Gammaproteobacteria bacterium]|nr:hypothetical protein [Gammaproteobacteria bacterium]
MQCFRTLAILVATLFSGTALASDSYSVPRTEFGVPDLQGVWNFSSSIPMQRPLKYGNRQFLNAKEIAELEARSEARDEASDAAIPGTGVDEAYNDFWIESAGLGQERLTSHIIYPINGRLPALQEKAYRPILGELPARPVRSALGATFATDGPEDRPLSDRCILGFNAGPPVNPSFYNNNIQIVQNQDHIVILTEMVHDARIVPLDGRPHADEAIGQWTGDSRGHWEGDALVVETRNFNGLTHSFSRMGSSKNKKLVEKFTRVAADRIDYEFTIFDSDTFTDQIVGLIPFYKVAGQVYEYACHEGNYGMVNILRGARVADLQQK